MTLTDPAVLLCGPNVPCDCGVRGCAEVVHLCVGATCDLESPDLGSFT